MLAPAYTRTSVDPVSMGLVALARTSTARLAPSAIAVIVHSAANIPVESQRTSVPGSDATRTGPIAPRAVTLKLVVAPALGMITRRTESSARPDAVAGGVAVKLGSAAGLQRPNRSQRSSAMHSLSARHVATHRPSSQCAPQGQCSSARHRRALASAAGSLHAMGPASATSPLASDPPSPGATSCEPSTAGTSVGVGAPEQPLTDTIEPPSTSDIKHVLPPDEPFRNCAYDRATAKPPRGRRSATHPPP